MFVSPARLLDRVLGWPVRSQHGACRNALVAATALADRRRELTEVEEFLERHAVAAGRRETLEVTAPRAL